MYERRLLVETSKHTTMVGFVDKPRAFLYSTRVYDYTILLQYYIMYY